jgi:hypothetical protein
MRLKGSFLFLLHLFLVTHTWAQLIFFQQKLLTPFSEGAMALVDEGRLVLFVNMLEKTRYPNQRVWQKFLGEDIVWGSDGFARMSAFGEEWVVVFGGNHFIRINGEYPSNYEKTIAPLGRLYDFNIQSIRASSYLLEKTKDGEILYKPDSIMKRFMSDPMRIVYLWNDHIQPWVEGVEGSGVGEYLDVSFDSEMDHVVILNGFVDPLRPHLFKANGRIRKVRVESLEDVSFSFEYDFLDRVEFSYIPFPKKVKGVRLTILNVYAGARWQDTAVTAIVTNHSWNFFDSAKIKEYFNHSSKYLR